jgi:hypothetical protein
MKTFSRTIELTEAQIEGLNTGSPVPFTLLTAPPAGKAFVVTSAQLWKTAGAAATVGTGEIIISYGADTNGVYQFANVDASTGALGNNAQDCIQIASHLSNAVAANGATVTISANAAIACATGTTAKIKLDCQIIDL